MPEGVSTVPRTELSTLSSLRINPGDLNMEGKGPGVEIEFCNFEEGSPRLRQEMERIPESEIICWNRTTKIAGLVQMVDESTQRKFWVDFMGLKAAVATVLSIKRGEETPDEARRRVKSFFPFLEELQPTTLNNFNHCLTDFLFRPPTIPVTWKNGKRVEEKRGLPSLSPPPEELTPMPSLTRRPPADREATGARPTPPAMKQAEAVTITPRVEWREPPRESPWQELAKNRNVAAVIDRRLQLKLPRGGEGILLWGTGLHQGGDPKNQLVEIYRTEGREEVGQMFVRMNDLREMKRRLYEQRMLNATHTTKKEIALTLSTREQIKFYFTADEVLEQIQQIERFLEKNPMV